MNLNYPKDWRDDNFEKRYTYAIIDTRPLNDHIYIGQTNDYKRRFQEHKSQWNKDLKAAGFLPKMVILESDDMTKYESAQFESIWILVAINENYTLLNSEGDKSRSTNTFVEIENLAKLRTIPKEYTELIKTQVGEIFFLPKSYINGVPGVYVEGIDFSVQRRIMIEDVLDELYEEFRLKDPIYAELFKK